MKKQIKSKRKKGLTPYKFKRYCYTFLFGIVYLFLTPFIIKQLWDSKHITEAAEQTEETETEAVAETEPANPETSEQEEQSETTAETLPPREYVTSEASYFDDALFIGDSRTVGLCNYGTLPNADYFCTGGLAAYEILDGKEIDGSTLEELLSENAYGKIYVMVGLNEIAFGLEDFHTHIQELYHLIHENAPDALIFMMANLHVTQAFSEESNSISNNALNQANAYIEELADGQTCFYIDVNPLFDDENGYLSAEYSSDGSHISGYDYARWCDWLCTQTIVQDSQEEGLVSFSDAVRAVKEKKAVTRQAWKNQAIQLLLASSPTEGNYIAMKKEDGTLVAWEASQEELLAEDWIILE